MPVTSWDSLVTHHCETQFFGEKIPEEMISGDFRDIHPGEVVGNR